jgi:AraC-like DNA-binding protein
LEKRDNLTLPFPRTVTADPSQPRGVLHSRLDAGEFQHVRRAPSASLADLVEHYWSVSWDLHDLPPQTQETLPHPNVHLVVEPDQTRIYGVHTGRFTRVLQGRGQVFGIKFKAAGFQPFFGAPVSRLVNRSLPATDLFGDRADGLENDVLAAPDMATMAAIAERLLLAFRPATPTPDIERVNALVAGIADDRSLTSVEQLAERSKLSRRALQRLFQHYVGVGPKWVISRYRLHEAVAQLQAGTSVALPQLALELGYFDQAHFIRDFRKLVGRSPADYRRDERLDRRV